MTLTDEAGDRLQFSRQFVQPVQPHLILEHAMIKKPREVLQLLDDHEAQQSIQPSQAPCSNSLLHTQQSSLISSEQRYSKGTGTGQPHSTGVWWWKNIV